MPNGADSPDARKVYGEFRRRLLVVDACESLAVGCGGCDGVSERFWCSFGNFVENFVELTGLRVFLNAAIILALGVVANLI